jgi:hypothetical protein
MRRDTVMAAALNRGRSCAVCCAPAPYPWSYRPTGGGGKSRPAPSRHARASHRKGAIMASWKRSHPNAETIVGLAGRPGRTSGPYEVFGAARRRAYWMLFHMPYGLEPLLVLAALTGPDASNNLLPDH